MRVISAEYVTIIEWGGRAGSGNFSLKKDLMEHPAQCAICHPPIIRRLLWQIKK
jgi:hypothetical protein